ncbi:NRAMP family divalent metal transporter [Conexibacter sp. DBS9H8]|uniref:NRAMP family divalent metal transporter n=1 Tax=Conexibacter sp. DBS9H8 TaxID=2937801 RepID=UPI00200D307B|nr:divalent metal cation transporter [Conexibacter sp. DBS9H8]
MNFYASLCGVNGDPQMSSGGAATLPLGPSRTPGEGPALSAEDVARSRDRSRVAGARHGKRRIYLLWLLIGPGILAMLGENDGPSMISYAATGATYGYGFFLPFIVITFVMAMVCQEMSMRVGAVTHRGYGELVFQRYGRVWGWFAAGDLVFTNVVTLVAEFVAIRVGLAYFHLGAGVAAGLGVALVVFTLGGGRYWRWERVVLGLALFNGLFLAAALLVKPDWHGVDHAFTSFGPFPGGSFNTILLLFASTIGATVTPWMVFFQQSASADKGLTPKDIAHGRIDTAVGGLLAAVFGCGALIAGAALATHGGAGIQGLAGAGFPAALRAHSGGLVGTLFALGLIEAGAVAVLTISASTGYAVGEAIGRSSSFNSAPRHAVTFYGVNVLVAAVAAAVILIPGAPLLSIALNANVLATVLLPVTLIFMVMLANDRQLMGAWANGRLINTIAVAIVLFITVAGAAYGIDSFLQTVHLVGG